MGVRAVAGVVLLLAVLSGCNLTTTITCVDPVDFETPADAAESASLVVVGTVTGSAGERAYYQETAPVHRFAVESVLKGELTSRTIEVASVPQTCNGEAGSFPDGDPLDTDQRVELFLFEAKGEYRLITPWDGVAAAPAGEPLPWTG